MVPQTSVNAMSFKSFALHPKLLTLVSGIVSERHAFVSVRDDLIAYRLWKPLRMYKALAIFTMMKRIPNSYYNHGIDISKVVTFTREMQFKKFI